MARSETIDLQGCESCEGQFPIEQMILMVDCWFCEKCYAEWKAEFDKCEHAWEPETSDFGEPGKYCSRCSGFVVGE